MSQGNGTPIDNLVSALHELEPTINPACGDSPATILPLLNYVFKRTPFDIVLRPSSDAPVRVGMSEDPPVRAPTPSIGKETLSATTPTGKKTLSQNLFEYEVMSILRTRESVTTRKPDLAAALPPKLKFGSPAAITTRLNKMARSEETGYINWDKGKQKTPITATAEGKKRLLQLEGTGPGSLSPEEKKFLKKHGGWFGPSLDKPES